MEIIKAEKQENGILINGNVYLTDGNTGHVRASYDEWLSKGNTPTDAQAVATVES